MHKVNVNVVSNGYISTVPITFHNGFDHRLNGETGEPIRVCGEVVTSHKDYGTKVKYYQNYVANGIS